MQLKKFNGNTTRDRLLLKYHNDSSKSVHLQSQLRLEAERRENWIKTCSLRFKHEFVFHSIQYGITQPSHTLLFFFKL